MLTANRPALARRAVECFRAQTYKNKRLCIWDTTKGRPFALSMNLPDNERCVEDVPDYSIGELRNRAVDWVTSDYRFPYGGEQTERSEILCHFDDDDLSHPNRIAEQVALMDATGAEVVGYSELLFWREAVPAADDFYVEDAEDCFGDLADGGEPGEAWLYRGTILGTSLMYRREVWERFPFPATSYGEDTEWLKQVQHAGVKIMAEGMNRMGQPRMIARIHAGNTSKAYAPEAMREATHHWSRVPEWDAYCREVME